MQTIILTSAIMIVISFSQLMGQSTSKTSVQSQNREGRRDISTITETRTQALDLMQNNRQIHHATPGFRSGRYGWL